MHATCTLKTKVGILPKGEQRRAGRLIITICAWLFYLILGSTATHPIMLTTVSPQTTCFHYYTVIMSHDNS